LTWWEIKVIWNALKLDDCLIRIQMKESVKYWFCMVLYIHILKVFSTYDTKVKFKYIFLLKQSYSKQKHKINKETLRSKSTYHNHIVCFSNSSVDFTAGAVTVLERNNWTPLQERMRCVLREKRLYVDTAMWKGYMWRGCMSMLCEEALYIYMLMVKDKNNGCVFVDII
jgi:hypothetical protein